jgi:hypothetical protein
VASVVTNAAAVSPVRITMALASLTSDASAIARVMALAS